MEIIGFICTVIVLAEIGYLFYAFVMSKFTKDETITIECTQDDAELLNKIKRLSSQDKTELIECLEKKQWESKV